MLFHLFIFFYSICGTIQGDDNMSLRVSSKPPKDRLESQQDPTKIVVSLTRSAFGGFKKT